MCQACRLLKPALSAPTNVPTQSPKVHLHDLGDALQEHVVRAGQVELSTLQLVCKIVSSLQCSDFGLQVAEQKVAHHMSHPVPTHSFERNTAAGCSNTMDVERETKVSSSPLSDSSNSSVCSDPSDSEPSSLSSSGDFSHSFATSNSNVVGMKTEVDEHPAVPSVSILNFFPRTKD